MGVGGWGQEENKIRRQRQMKKGEMGGGWEGEGREGVKGGRGENRKTGRRNKITRQRGERKKKEERKRGGGGGGKRR